MKREMVTRLGLGLVFVSLAVCNNYLNRSILKETLIAFSPVFLLEFDCEADTWRCWWLYKGTSRMIGKSVKEQLESAPVAILSRVFTFVHFVAIEIGIVNIVKHWQTICGTRWKPSNTTRCAATARAVWHRSRIENVRLIRCGRIKATLVFAWIQFFLCFECDLQ